LFGVVDDIAVGRLWWRPTCKQLFKQLIFKFVVKLFIQFFQLQFIIELQLFFKLQLIFW